MEKRRVSMFRNISKCSKEHIQKGYSCLQPFSLALSINLSSLRSSLRIHWKGEWPLGYNLTNKSIRKLKREPIGKHFWEPKLQILVLPSNENWDANSDYWLLSQFQMKTFCRMCNINVQSWFDLVAQLTWLIMSLRKLLAFSSRSPCKFSKLRQLEGP